MCPRDQEQNPEHILSRSAPRARDKLQQQGPLLPEGGGQEADIALQRDDHFDNHLHCKSGLCIRKVHNFTSHISSSLSAST